MPRDSPSAIRREVSAETSSSPSLEGVKVLNPWNMCNKAINPGVVTRILRRYGWKGRINDFTLFERACVHKSYVDRPEVLSKLAQEYGVERLTIADQPPGCLPLRTHDNEELEFVGDRVVGLAVSTYLTERYRGYGEGFFTRVLSRIVNNKQLGFLATEIGLPPWIIISRHMEEVCDGRNNIRILGSFFEAWIGALYLQEKDPGRGYQFCHDFIVAVIEKHVDFVQIITEDTNYKDQLIRLFQAKYKTVPRYVELHVEGPQHDRTYEMAVLRPDGGVLSTSVARNKKVAEQEASRIAIGIIEGEGGAEGGEGGGEGGEGGGEGAE